jgi:hypothetical protein
VAPAPDFSELQDLARQVRELADRVAELERRTGIERAVSAAPAPAVSIASDIGDAAGLTAHFGKALLGIAAAYLLRALSESHYLPVRTGVGLGIVYAMAWLWLASRANPLAALLRAVCATLILIPLLWEAQFRFRALPDWIAAGILVLFSTFGLGISWKKNLSAVAWVATLSGTFALFAMLIASRDLVPFTWALLALAAVVEVSACLEHWIRERWIIAVVADLSVVLMTYLVTQRTGLPEGYSPVSRTAVLAIQISLLLIYLLSATFRTLRRGFVVSGFEIAQCATAFVVVGWGAVKVAETHPAAVIGVGLFCALCCAGCYTVSFLFHTRIQEKDRNFYTYATFGLVLAIAATSLLAGGVARIAVWSALAVILAELGSRTGRSTLVWHGVIYLLSALVASGLGLTIAGRLLRPVLHPGPPLWDASAWTISAASVLACFAIWRTRADSGGRDRAAGFVLSGIAALAVAGIGAALSIWFCPAGTSSEGHSCATMLTALLAVMAVALAWAGRRAAIWELTRIPYVLLAIATVKLLVQDLRAGHMFAIVISLVLYGSALVILPRLVLVRSTATAA